MKQVKKAITTKLFHEHKRPQMLGLGLFWKLYNGQITTAVMYISTANTLQPVSTLSKDAGKRARRRQMVKIMTMKAKMKQME